MARIRPYALLCGAFLALALSGAGCAAPVVLNTVPVLPGVPIMISPIPCPGILEARDLDGDGLIDEAAVIPEPECLKRHLQSQGPPPRHSLPDNAS